ncbi:MAG TPA: FGGY family carbohydrate kinase [Candidatus Polarisedimenticolia bacterium]|nr:FGGY family carbohydrate kinase [Candidatus Polarisedimenticolia bacterium]
MRSDRWVGIDQGSTATKAILLDGAGRVVRVVTLPVATRFPASGWVEQDAEALAASVRRALGRVLEGEKLERVRGVGIACQRSTCLFWDAVSGRPLTAALSWRDVRGAAHCDKLARHARLVEQKTGLRLSPHYAASKLRWLLRRNPDLRSKARQGKARCGTLDAYLLFRLTGGDSFSTDPTHAARTLLMDLTRREWDAELLDLFGIPLRALPPIRPGAFPAGEIALRGTRLRIAATLGDQQAALLGSGCRRAGEMVINFGTGAFAALNTGRRVARVPGLLTSVAWSSEKEVRFLLEGTVNSAGSAVDWIDRLASGRNTGTGNRLRLDRIPIFIPALTGIAAPHWRSDRLAAILDMRPDTGAAELHEAALAGVACRVREIVERMAAAKSAPRRMVLSGGLLRDRRFVALQAAILGRRLEIPEIPEATALGAAALARHFLRDLDLNREAPRPARSVVPASSAESERYYRRFRSHLDRLLS